jgi:hypothetical protein
MPIDIDLTAIRTHVEHLRSAAEALETLSRNFPALNRNTARILASLKMIEINLESDSG